MTTYRVTEHYVYYVEAEDADAAADVIVWEGPDGARTVEVEAVANREGS